MYKMGLSDANKLRDFVNDDRAETVLVKGTHPETAAVVWLRFDRDATGGFGFKVRDAEERATRFGREILLEPENVVERCATIKAAKDRIAEFSRAGLFATHAAYSTPWDLTNGREVREMCGCGHPVHAGQCPAPDGCWCDDFTDGGV